MRNNKATESSIKAFLDVFRQEVENRSQGMNRFIIGVTAWKTIKTDAANAAAEKVPVAGAAYRAWSARIKAAGRTNMGKVKAENDLERLGQLIMVRTGSSVPRKGKGKQEMIASNGTSLGIATNMTERYRILADKGIVPDDTSASILMGTSEKYITKVRGELEAKGYVFSLEGDFYRVTVRTSAYYAELLQGLIPLLSQHPDNQAVAALVEIAQSILQEGK